MKYFNLFVNERKGNPIDDNWINNEKPVLTKDGRVVIILDIDRSKVPNVLIGKVKYANRLLDYTWDDTGRCLSALDNFGNGRLPEESDNIVKGK